MPKSKISLWLSKYPILADDDLPHLEQEAAINEFGERRLPRELAEKEAYNTYKKNSHAKAAAYHLLRMRASSGEESAKHAAHYGFHVEAMGFPAHGEVPDDVKNAIQAEDFESPVKFKNHPGDNLLLQSTQKSLQNRLDILYKACNVSLELTKALSKLDLCPAFRNRNTGEIYKSPGMHDISVVPEEHWDNVDDGFVDSKGNFMSRKQASAAVGLEPLHPLTSEEVYDANDKSEPGLSM